MNYTEDTGVWNDMEHEFAGYMTTKITPDQDKERDVFEFLDDFYTWVLEYGRGLDQDDYIAFVRVYAPDLLKIVEVEQ